MKRYTIRQRTIGLVVLALLIFAVAGSVLSRPETYGAVFRSIDRKMENVLGMTAACTTVSSLITAVPDDAGTPIATQLAEYTDLLMIIFAVLLTEKYLMTTLAAILCRVLLPAAILSFLPQVPHSLEGVRRLLIKITGVALACYLMIPVSMLLSDHLLASYETSFDQTISAGQNFGEESQGGEMQNSWWSTVTSGLTAVAELPQRAVSFVNQLIQSIAVMIVTSCVIPLLTLAAFLWLVKQITGQKPQILLLPQESKEKE